MKSHNKKPAKGSLVTRDSTGGEIADDGLTFQNDYVAIKCLSLLSRHGFESLTQESVGDSEFRIFTPEHGSRIHFVQVKNKRLVLGEFWSVIRNFESINQNAPNQYASFTLVVTDVADEIKTLVRALYRIRGPKSFYGTGSIIMANSLADFADLVVAHKGTQQDANFLIQFVDIEDDVAPIASNPELIFYKVLSDIGPECHSVSLQFSKGAFVSLCDLLRRRKNQAVYRKDILKCLRSVLPETSCFADEEIAIHTSADVNDLDEQNSFRFAWQNFSGNDKREYPAATAWNEHLLEPLLKTRQWLLANYDSRRIRLTGTRRISAAIALGHVFNAVSGFSVQMIHRGDPWDTNDHPTSSTPIYEFEQLISEGVGDEFVVGVGIGRDVKNDVQVAIDDLRLLHSSILLLHNRQPIESPQQANLAVSNIKYAISELLHGSDKRIHLFYAGPTHAALFLGHRLNAIGRIQCYEWLGPGMYTPTLLLS